MYINLSANFLSLLISSFFLNLLCRWMYLFLFIFSVKRLMELLSRTCSQPTASWMELAHKWKVFGGFPYHYNEVKGCRCVPKDLANRWTDLVTVLLLMGPGMVYNFVFSKRFNEKSTEGVIFFYHCGCTWIYRPSSYPLKSLSETSLKYT